MFVPAVAVAGPVLTTARSALAIGVTTTLELLFAGFGSVWSIAVRVAVFVNPLSVSTSATIVSVFVAPGPDAAIAPIVHTPVPLSYVVPALGVADTNVRPAGSTSVSATPVAALG